ncbi:MAG: hypothetical protein WCO05_00205 [Candidatus Moraniibacteriota bacterium]
MASYKLKPPFDGVVEKQLILIGGEFGMKLELILPPILPDILAASTYYYFIFMPFSFNFFNLFLNYPLIYFLFDYFKK